MQIVDFAWMTVRKSSAVLLITCDRWKRLMLTFVLQFAATSSGICQTLFFGLHSTTFVSQAFGLAFAPALSHDWWCQKEQARRQKQSQLKIPVESKSSQTPPLPTISWWGKCPSQNTKKNKHKIKWKTTYGGGWQRNGIGTVAKGMKRQWKERGQCVNCSKVSTTKDNK